MTTTDTIKRETFDCVACWLEQSADAADVPDPRGWEMTAEDFDSIATAAGLSLRFAEWDDRHALALDSAWSEACNAAAIALEHGADVDDVAKALRAPWVPA